MQHPREKLRGFFEIKPRLTVAAALLLSASDVLALAALNWLAASLLALALACLPGVIFFWLRRPLIAVALAMSAIAMFAYAHFRLANDRLSERFVGPVECCGFIEKVEGGNENARVFLRVVRVRELNSKQAESFVLPCFAPCVVAHMPACDLPAEKTSSEAPGKPLISLSGKFSGSAAAKWPWDFDEQRYWARQGVQGLLEVAADTRLHRLSSSECAVTVPPDWVGNFAAGTVATVDAVRSRMVQVHRVWLGQELGDLLSSMVIGDKAVSPSATIKEWFRQLGLSHIIAASGFNLTVVTAVAWFAIRFIVRSPIFVSLWCFAAIVAFCALAGFSPSVERAAIMCTIMLAATCLRRCVHLPASVAAALIVTLVLDPAALTDVGLQLSYSATFAIACTVTRFDRFLSAALRLPAVLSELLGVVVIACAAVLPLQLFYFWQVGLLSLAANVLVSPLVPIITVLGFVSSAVAAIDCPAAFNLVACLDGLTFWALKLMMIIVQSLAACKWSVVTLGPPPAALVVFYYCAFCLVCALRCPFKRLAGMLRATAIAVYVLALAALFVRLPIGTSIVVCTRAAILIVAPASSALLLGDTEDVSLKRACLFLRVRNLTCLPLPNELSRHLAGHHVPFGQSRVYSFDGDRVRRLDNVSSLYQPAPERPTAISSSGAAALQ